MRRLVGVPDGGLLLVGVYRVSSSVVLQAVIGLLLVVGVLGAIWLGVAMYRPALRLGWFALAGAFVLWGV